MPDPLVYRWELTDLQFKVLCEERRIGGLPRPFTFTSRARYADDYEAGKDEVRAWLRQVDDPRFESMINALTKPDIMVTANLWHEQEYTDPQRCIRVHSVRRDERAYVIVQRPGETVAHSAGFDIAECRPEVLARTVIGLLPEMPAGGDPDAVRVGSASGDAPPTARESGTSAAILAPGPDSGVLKVIQGHLGFRERGIIHVGLAWCDVPGDGRYVVGPPLEGAVGMDGTAICAWIDERMAEIMVRLEP